MTLDVHDKQFKGVSIGYPANIATSRLKAEEAVLLVLMFRFDYILSVTLVCMGSLLLSSAGIMLNPPLPGYLGV